MWIRFATTVSAVVLITLAALPVRSADIVGQIVDQGRGPVAGLGLSLVNQAGAPIAMTKSDATGSYSFHDIAPGIYSLSFEGQSSVAYVPEDGLTVNWGIGRNSPPVAVAKRGATIPRAEEDAPSSAAK